MQPGPNPHAEPTASTLSPGVALSSFGGLGIARLRPLERSICIRGGGRCIPIGRTSPPRLRPPPGPDASTLGSRGRLKSRPNLPRLPGLEAHLEPRWRLRGVSVSGVRPLGVEGPGGPRRTRRPGPPPFPPTPVDLAGGSFLERLTPARWRLLRRPRPLRRTRAGKAVAAAAETTG